VVSRLPGDSLGLSGKIEFRSQIWSINAECKTFEKRLHFPPTFMTTCYNAEEFKRIFLGAHIIILQEIFSKA